MEDTTKKSRLNLILISILISIYYVADIKISGISFFGLSIDPGNPASLIYFVWVAWAYLFLRYITYYLDQGAHDTRIAIRESLARSIAISLVKTRAKDALLRNPKWKASKIQINSIDIIKSEADMIRFKYSGKFSGDNYTSVNTELEHTSYSVEWTLLDRYKAMFRSLLMHPEILEYWAPIIIGLIPLVVVVINVASTGSPPPLD